MPDDLPPWQTVYQQTQRWIKAGVFEDTVTDLRTPVGLGDRNVTRTTAANFASRTIQSRVKSGGRAGWDEARKRRGTKIQLAVDTLGHFLALAVTPADEQDREQVEALAAAVQETTGDDVELAYVDQSYTGGDATEAAAGWGIRLKMVKLPDAKRGFVLLPRH